jgi:hypothetical protein
MIIGVPAGIGDASWVVSKLINAPEWPNIEFIIAGGWPYRTKPLFDMVGVKSTYGHFNYEEILMFEKVHPYITWKNISSNGFGIFYIQPNQHLERGEPLSEYLPDLKTDYHYKLKMPSITAKPYYKKLTVGKWVGISAASYRGHQAWNTWPMEQWRRLCEMLIRRGYNICLLGGSWDDLTRSLSDYLGKRCLNLVGQTTFQEACAIHKMLDYYIGFASGLGIIRTVLRLPTIMLWPAHMPAHMYSWADPKDVEEGKYLASTYAKPKEIFKLFKAQENS